jgi:ATP-binding protein involved in chromosome partitioning
MSGNKEIRKDEILKALGNILDPDLHRDIVSLGFVKDVKVHGQDVDVTIELTTPACPVRDQMKHQAIEHIRQVGVSGSIKVNMTSRVISHQNETKEALLPGVKNTIAIASGKGGVGKSTVAANLAVALALDGAKVGLIDADVYGPSIPLMLGLPNGRPEVITTNGEQKIVPLENYSVKLMSIGFLVDPNTAVIWRGPMASGALKQFVSDVEWGTLDYLIFDLPPGTGDIQLTLVQTIPLTGAVIVTTPQDISLADARKGLKMFERVRVPVFGIIENMSYFVCSRCGQREEIFSYGGGKKAAAELGVPFLGEIPIYTNIRIAGDLGKPIVISEPESEQAKLIMQISRNLASQVSIRHLTSPGPQKIDILIGNNQ